MCYFHWTLKFGYRHLRKWQRTHSYLRSFNYLNFHTEPQWDLVWRDKRVRKLHYVNQLSKNSGLFLWGFPPFFCFLPFLSTRNYFSKILGCATVVFLGDFAIGLSEVRMLLYLAFAIATQYLWKILIFRRIRAMEEKEKGKLLVHNYICKAIELEIPFS